MEKIRQRLTDLEAKVKELEERLANTEALLQIGFQVSRIDAETASSMAGVQRKKNKDLAEVQAEAEKRGIKFPKNTGSAEGGATR